jgi:amidophosphoribosyltransferase
MSHMFSLCDDDKLHEECGIFGISPIQDASAHTALGLHALQHRGQEAAGIVAYDGKTFHIHKAQGHVGDHFNTPHVMEKLQGHKAIGHVRYPTSGASNQQNIQPIFAEYSFGGMAIAHNGNLTNALTLRKGLVERGCLFQSTMDTEIIIHLLAISKQATLIDRLIEALRMVEGAYSLIGLSSDFMIGVRDPLGVRPMVLGKLGTAYVIASESCALDIIGADFVRDVEPGEMVIVEGETLRSLKPFAQNNQRFCLFEYVYFARPDSVIDGQHVYEVRKAIGRELAKESHVNADIVVPVPDSGVPSALGYAAAVQLPFELGIIRNHYVGRTFIEPTDQVRHLGVKLKHNANASLIAGKSIILVDDSIVRGTTSKKIVTMLRDAGAKAIHMRIASPPTKHPCFYGVDTPEQSKLMAAQYDVDKMAELIGADSLAFISIDGLYRAAGEAKRNSAQPKFCDACFTGDYPIVLTDRANQLL